MNPTTLIRSPKGHWAWMIAFHVLLGVFLGLILSACSKREEAPSVQKEVQQQPLLIVSNQAKTGSLLAPDAKIYSNFSLSIESEKMAGALADYAEGLRAESRGDMETALKLYESATDKDPSQQELALRVATEWLRRGNTQRAIERLEKMTGEDTQHAELQVNLSLAYILNGQTNEARKAAMAALNVSNTSAQAYAILYKLDTAEKGEEEALNLLRQRQTEVSPNQNNLWVATAEAYARILTDVQKMSAREVARFTLPLFKEALDFQPNDMKLLSRVAELYSLNSQFTQAIALFQKALKQEPKNEGFLSKLALVYAESGDLKASAITLEKIIQIKPERETVYSALADIYSRLGDQKKAKKYFLEAEKRGMNTALITEAALRDRNWKLAELSLKLAKERQPSNQTHWLRLIYVLLAQGKHLEAALIGEEAARNFPEASDVALQAAVAQRENKNFIRAMQRLQEAEKLARSNQEDSILSDVFFEWGVLMEQSGKREEAEKRFKKAVDFNPTDHRSMNYLSFMWADRNMHLDEALELVNKALELDPKNAAYLDTLGWIYYRQGKYDEALVKIQQAIQFSEGDAEIYDHLGDVLEKLEKYHEALEAWEKAYQLNPRIKKLEEKISHAHENQSKTRR